MMKIRYDGTYVASVEGFNEMVEPGIVYEVDDSVAERLTGGYGPMFSLVNTPVVEAPALEAPAPRAVKNKE